jgi:dolichol-phosphate mannosyltransferase
MQFRQPRTTATAANRVAGSISVVLPVYNEESNLRPMCQSIADTMRAFGRPYEIIAVNDGSQDGSMAELLALANDLRELKLIDFRRNFGQTAAIMAGIDHACGDIVVLIDADLQNDPADIPRLVAKLEEGFDVVSGWRKERRDQPIRRNFVSRVANRIISRVSGVQLNDYGCTLKAYRRDMVEDIRLYGEMHRFIPIYATWMGARVTELPVTHHARRHGKSKYGLDRTIKVLLDLMVIKFLDRYFVKPIYVFGGFGVLFCVAAGGFFLWMLYLKIFESASFILTPLPLLAAVTFMMGVVSILMGLLAEMLVRTYFESQNRPAYQVRRLINFADEG